MVTSSNELSASTSSARPAIHRTLSTPRARCLRASELDGLRFLVDGPDLREVRRETEGDLTGTAREIQQPARARDLRSHEQIVEERLRIARRRNSS